MNIAIMTPVYGEYPNIWVESLINLFGIKDISFPLISRGGGSNITAFRNTLIQDLFIVEEELHKRFDYLLWVDSDIGYAREDFIKLFNHIKNKEVVSGVYFQKSSPYSPVAGYYDLNNLSDGFPAITKQELLSKETFEVDWFGMGFVLMRRSVLDSLEYPWFEMTIVDLPKSKLMKGGLTITKELLSEDISFWKKIGDKGHKLYVDTSILLKHRGSINFSIDHFLAVN